MTLATAQTAALKIDADGHVTMPKQSAFNVGKSGTQTNIGNANTITFDTERFDQNSDFASNQFTAPVTGKYLINYQVRVNDMPENMTYALINTTSSNATYQNIFSPGTSDEDVGWRTFTGSLVIDMDANDTVKLVYGEDGGSTGTADINDASYFSGCLLA